MRDDLLGRLVGEYVKATVHLEGVAADDLASQTKGDERSEV